MKYNGFTFGMQAHVNIIFFYHTLLTKSLGYLTLNEHFSKFQKMFVNDSSHHKMTLVDILNAQI